MPWADLALAATQASAEVALVCVAGAVLARYGVFTQQVQRAMAKANMFLFTPCLLFVKIAATVTPDKFIELWPVPLSFVLFSALGWLLAVVGSPLLRLSEPQRRFAIVSMMFSNSNSLPIALMQSLSLSKSVSVLYWGEDDTVDSVVARGMTYIMFFGLAGNFVRWSYGYKLIGRGDGSEPETSVAQSQNGDWSTAEPRQLCEICRSSSTSLTNGPACQAVEGTRAETFVSLTPEDDGSSSPDAPLLGRSAVRCQCLGGPCQLETNLASRVWIALRLYGKAFWKHARAFVKAMMTAPIVTTLVALLVGLVTPLRDLMFGPDAPLRSSLTAAIDQCGNASVPLILLSLGAQLATLPSEKKAGKSFPMDAEAPSAATGSTDALPETQYDIAKRTALHSDSHVKCASVPVAASTSTLVLPTHASSEYTSRASSRDSFRPLQARNLTRVSNYRTIALVLLGRLIVSPLIAAPIVFAARPYMGALANDPVFLLVLVLLGSSPTAINLIQICQVHGYFEADMARLLFVSYIGAIPIITAVVTAAMAILDGLKREGNL